MALLHSLTSNTIDDDYDDGGAQWLLELPGLSLIFQLRGHFHTIRV